MERIDDLMLNAIAQDIGPSEDKTRVLGLNLKLELTTIRQHISPNGGNVSASDRLKMILDWRERTPREQQKVRMKTALEISGFGEIADRYFGEGRLSGVGEKRKLTPTGNNFYMEGEPLPSVSRLHNGDNNHAEDGDEREEEDKRLLEEIKRFLEEVEWPAEVKRFLEEIEWPAEEVKRLLEEIKRPSAEEVKRFLEEEVKRFLEESEDLPGETRPGEDLPGEARPALPPLPPLPRYNDRALATLAQLDRDRELLIHQQLLSLWRVNEIQLLEERYTDRGRLNLHVPRYVLTYNPKPIKRSSNSQTLVEASHHDIFRSVKNGSLNSKRIVVSGNNLTENTALSRRLAYDWATQDRASSLVGAHIVLEIDLKKVTDDQDLAAAVKEQLFQGMDLTADVIRERIKANPRAVTVLLDGLSEFSTNGYKGDILDILYGKALMDLTVMVTSRPRAAAQLEMQASCNYTFFEL